MKALIYKQDSYMKYSSHGIKVVSCDGTPFLNAISDTRTEIIDFSIFFFINDESDLLTVYVQNIRTALF